MVPALAKRRETTPSQSTGPFYPVELPLDDDNDLVQVTGSEQSAKGRISELTGRILDQNEHPLAGARIEIWQCDVNGRYRHPRDSGGKPIDPGFQGHGHTTADHLGRYRFRTIRPVPYPGRTPHIHVVVLPKGEQAFVTQLYVAGEQRNADDFLYRRVPAERRHLVTAEFRDSKGKGAELTANWDVVLGLSGS
jgi:protocatechuate 3,4-dioxygenase beta subunit